LQGSGKRTPIHKHERMLERINLKERCFLKKVSS
jgi:hypothetical protein